MEHGDEWAGGHARRQFLAGLGTAATASLAGCMDLLGFGPEGSGDGGGTGGSSIQPGQIGSGRVGRAPPGGTPMGAMPALSGRLTLYSGRGEFLIGDLMAFLEDRYPDLDLRVRYDSATQLANQIRTEGQNSPADVFFTVNSGVLGLLAGEGRTQALPEDVLALGRPGYQDPDGDWIGTSGRVRAVPYNSDTFDAADIPTDIFAFPELERFRGSMGWAPTYGSFQGFITAMRILNGPERTMAWLRAMLDHGTREYSDEFRVAQAVADGEITAGFTNHYYVIRVLDGQPDAPIDMAFTERDAGSFFNVAGAAVVDTATNYDRAANFIRHLLSAEAQDYFARSRTFEYPMIPEVDPIDRLPPFEAIRPPDLDLPEFAQADVNETIALMEEARVL